LVIIKVISIFVLKLKNYGSVIAFQKKMYTNNYNFRWDMASTFKFENQSYRLDDLSPAGQEIFSSLFFVTRHIEQIKNSLAVLNRAKNGYIDDLKLEVIEEKSGIIMSELFTED